MLVRTFLDEKRLVWAPVRGAAVLRAAVRLFREMPEPPPFADDSSEDRQVVCAALRQATALSAGDEH
jgi:hypothetical protein